MNAKLISQPYSTIRSGRLFKDYLLKTDYLVIKDNICNSIPKIYQQKVKNLLKASYRRSNTSIDFFDTSIKFLHQTPMPACIRRDCENIILEQMEA